MDDAGLRRSYLEEYAARDARKRLSRLNKALGITQQRVDRWLRDPDFAADVRRIDERRMQAALFPATTLWPRIVEEQASIGAGEPEEPPKLKGCTPEETRDLMAIYKARALKRMALSTRAAEFIAKVIGAVPAKPQVAIHAERVDTFGHLPDDLDGLIAENERLDGILARAKEWQAQMKAKEGNADTA